MYDNLQLVLIFHHYGLNVDQSFVNPGTSLSNAEVLIGLWGILVDAVVCCHHAAEQTMMGSITVGG